MKHKLIITLLFPAALCVCSCTGFSCTDGRPDTGAHRTAPQSLRLVSWNTETFFDAVKDGTEYSEFKSSKSNWNRDAYIGRLDRLCEVVRTLDADVYAFEEIENDGIMYDISNRLAGSAWNSRHSWNYACFAKTPGDATGCAVLSRFPLGAMTVHSLDIRTSGEQPQMRPIIEVSVYAGSCPLVLFINHWKSKAGGKTETETEKWRNWQESVLGKLIAGIPDSAAAACGDFNRDITGFLPGPENGTVLLRYLCSGCKKETTVVSPWIRSDGTYVKPGSYYFKNRWERIDHFFTAGTASAVDFAPVTDGPWADSSGVPAAYTVFTGKGWSDHLPVAATITY
ncbi:MAG: endonuclease/exonuclease/phosphatase family protein [Treponema sp.]